MKPENPKRIVGYERLSSREQAFNSPAREQQRTRLLSAGATEIFEDIESGRNDDRPQLQKLMHKVINREVDEVIVTKIDRLARSLPKLRECINFFLEAEVNLRVLDQQIDLTTSQGMLMLNILGAVAEMEVALTSDRVNHGKQHRRNKQAACECPPWGYRVVNNKYELDTQPILCLLEDRPAPTPLPVSEKELSNPHRDADTSKFIFGRSLADIAREIVALFLSSRSLTGTLKNIYEKYGFSKNGLARNHNRSALFSWSKTGLTRWLQNPVLCGHTVYNKSKLVGKKRKTNPPQEWTIISNTHPEHRLMTDEEAKEIREILATNQKLVGENFQRTLGSTERWEYSYQTGLVYCRECGSRCTSKTSTSQGKKYSYFACRHFGMGCQNRQSVDKQKIEDSLLKFLVEKSRQLRSDLAKEGELEPPKSDRLIELEKQLQAAESFPGFNINNERLKAELRQQITDEINLRRSLANQTVEQIIRSGNNLSFWHTLSPEEKVAVYHRIVEKIFIRHGQVDSILLKTEN